MMTPFLSFSPLHGVHLVRGVHVGIRKISPFGAPLLCRIRGLHRIAHRIKSPGIKSRHHIPHLVVILGVGIRTDRSGNLTQCACLQPLPAPSKAAAHYSGRLAGDGWAYLDACSSCTWGCCCTACLEDPVCSGGGL